LQVSPEERLIEVILPADCQMPDRFAVPGQHPVWVREQGAAVEAEIDVGSIGDYTLM